jgi:hypothetical protein
MPSRPATLITGVIAAVVAAFVVPAAPARAQAPERAPRVGVVIELAVDVEPARADSIGAALADGLNRELKVDAFGGEEVSRRLPPEGLPDECLAQSACVKDVAGRVDADQLIFLVVVQLGADVQVDASWVDVASGAVSARPRVILKADANAVTVFADAAERYLPEAKPRKTETIIIPGGGGGPGGPDHHMTTASWITGGVAVAALGGATVLGLTVRSRFDKCQRFADNDDDLDDCTPSELDAIESRALISDLTLGVGIAAVLTTAILYWRSDGDGEGTAVGVAPTAGGAVLGVSGHW